MFTKTADYYDALYSFKDYKVASDKVRGIIEQYNPSAKTLIDIGCGTGRHLEYLQENYEVEGVDINPDLVRIAQNRCPKAIFHQADMTNFTTAIKFDVAVCLFSAIAYVVTYANLKKTLHNFYQILNPGGIVIVEPWISPDVYRLNKITLNQFDSPDLKISWMYISELQDLASKFNIHYLVGTPSGVQSFSETHLMGLWTNEQIVAAFAEAGFEVKYDQNGLFNRGLYIGFKK